MDNEAQVPAQKGHNEGTAERPTIHVARSGTPYVELDDLVQYFLPTEEDVRGYIEENKEEVQGYIRDASANIERDGKENGLAPPAE